MHLPKPLYEALPYLYLLAGVLFVVGAAYVSHWYTGAPVYTFFGYFCLVAGVAVALRRYTYRRAARKAEEQGPGSDAIGT